MASLKLLIVEDDIASLELMTEVFLSLEAKVLAVNDGRHAAGLVDSEIFDGIFLDLQMPDMPGFELARRIRRSSRNRSTPIVIVTGHDDRQAMQQAFATGANFFLQKPVDRQKLTSLYRTVRGTLFENHCRHARIPFQTDVSCCLGSRTIRGKSLNLSQGGIQVEVEELKVGDKMQLSFQLPGSNIPIDGSGEVVWTEGKRKGVRFSQMGGRNLTEIRNVIARVETLEDFQREELLSRSRPHSDVSPPLLSAGFVSTVQKGRHRFGGQS